jgi:CRISPR-associated endonuclease/helicase Cas3
MLKPSKKIIEGVIPYDKCRAKTCADGSPGTRVVDHGIYAGKVAEQLFHFIPEPTRKYFSEYPGLLVALHDVGKISPGFQGKYFFNILKEHSPGWAKIFQNNEGTNTNHAEIGAAAIQAYYQLSVTAPPVVAVAAHHGFQPQRIDKTKDQHLWQQEREKLIQYLETIFRHPPSGEKISAPRADLLTGLLCVADWISSDETFFPPEDAPLPLEDLPDHVKKIVQQCGFRKAEFQQKLSFYDIFGFQPREEQKALIQMVSKPGVYIMEASMGTGKTEAALYAAYQLMVSGVNNGLYFALPTRLTSDRIHLRVEQFMRKILKEQQGVKLAHGQAWLKEFEYGSDDGERIRTPAWFSPSRRGLLYPFSVGTIDQALLSVMNVKHSFVRLFGLAGKVVILDEVHSYDLYTGTILDSLVQTLQNSGCTVIILSATLTKERRKKLLHIDCDIDNAYPLITGVVEESEDVVTSRPDSVQNRLTVACRWLYGNQNTVIENALQHARNGENVVCIANTVKKSQLWYRTLLSEMNEHDRTHLKYGLLHSRFPLYRREEIENEWMAMLGKGDAKRPTGSILIATQIVEQSVDIDADYMISELAPIDMLLQRTGRLWRHQRTNRPCQEPVLTITMENDPTLCTSLDEDAFQACTGTGSWYVYAPYVLLRTWEMLAQKRSLTLPADIRHYLEDVYDSAAIPTEPGLHLTLCQKMMKKQEKLQGLAVSAGVSVTSLPTRSDDDQNAPTRYNSQVTVSLLIVRDLDPAAGRDTVSMTLLDGQKVRISKYERDHKVTQKLYKNLVSIPATGILFDAKKDKEMLRQHFFASEMPFICLLREDGKSLRLYDANVPLDCAFRDDFGVFDNRQTAENSHGAILRDIPEQLPEEDNFIFKDGEDW